MTLFVDASALVAIIANEAESEHLLLVMEQDQQRTTSGIALWETARALARLSRDPISVADGLAEAQRWCAALAIGITGIDAAVAHEAARVQDRYGKGNHPARLNMGDCFAYACAKTNNAKLLYKGDDFVHTDMP
ncbi:type II toxin-antitoxin system VapC family toxin [Sphingomonas jeddahensis]|uniref:Ribonuclease VapC30 n=1 Tax=Sphingomonas jeddahensis TaxID=1915074 RepID=A0A1V2EWJ0_9SPHN|nr:type II toxin-antitoxin system VapC family toxin [Sphingomonas jeddahensis]ONF96867.1 Ribonuclease VapC30 [Sphingomonas jeddahensis]